MVPPILILVIGILIVLGLIIRFHVNAFLALIVAALAVSMLAPGEFSGKMSRVVSAFGSTAGGVGIIIAMAALIGRFMMDSGAADRIVGFFLSSLGEKRGGTALAISGFVLSIPVFFDTVFYLLVPVARSMYRHTGKHYLKYIMAIAAGGVVTHTLIPPTPGPLIVADTLNVDLGMMILFGALVGIPASLVGMLYCGWTDRRHPIPMRLLEPAVESADDNAGILEGGSFSDVQGRKTAPHGEAKLPGLFAAVLPILLPIGLVTAGSILSTAANSQRAAQLTQASVTDWPALLATLRADSATGPTSNLLAALPDETRAALHQGDPSDPETQAKLTAGLNSVLTSRGLYDYRSYLGVELSSELRGLLAGNVGRMQLAHVEHMNRLLLEATYPQISPHTWNTTLRQMAQVGHFFGDPNLALLLAAGVSMYVFIRQCQPTKKVVAAKVESALMSGGIIILITSAGGAFGAMLGKANLGPAIQSLLGGDGAAGMTMLLIAFGVASLLKFAQGSSTVAMITTSGMVAAMIEPATLGLHPVYLACAIGSGAMVGSWMNDSGFWIFCRMGGLTETESLQSWTPLLAVCGISAMVFTAILATFYPMAG